MAEIKLSTEPITNAAAHLKYSAKSLRDGVVEQSKKAYEAVKPAIDAVKDYGIGLAGPRTDINFCVKCGFHLEQVGKVNYCPNCGKRV